MWKRMKYHFRPKWDRGLTIFPKVLVDLVRCHLSKNLCPEVTIVSMITLDLKSTVFNFDFCRILLPSSPSVVPLCEFMLYLGCDAKLVLSTRGFFSFSFDFCCFPGWSYLAFLLSLLDKTSLFSCLLFWSPSLFTYFPSPLKCSPS